MGASGLDGLRSVESTAIASLNSIAGIGITDETGAAGLKAPGNWPLVCVTKLNPQISQKFTPAAGAGALQSGQTLPPVGTSGMFPEATGR